MDSEQQRYKELGDFLKTRRAKILPSQVGLLSGQRRRTPGLRREEVAQMAGISLTWYTWLEQGRPIHVSTPVVDSLAKVFQLDREECHLLYRLANQPLPILLPVGLKEGGGDRVDFEESAEMIEAYCKWLRDFAETAQIPVLDFRTFIDWADKDLYLDGIHQSPEGHQRMADRLITFLEKQSSQ
ncbi:MAG: hypothetical protein CVU92_02375 [Firmicutes bacterium HGW-Firmicutes-17]|jgi:lysophospholipase L1-like esterase|nr:MAG: hypothetical protein CVU92_02375 [Firmicutes bacterium HGW-Firmicutes-17]